MFRRVVDAVQIVVAAAAVLTVVLLFTVQPTVAVEETPDVAAGAELFADRCAACHSADGSGGVGPRLAGEGALARFSSVEEVARFVSTGAPGRMPGFETRLAPDDINAVALHVWTDLAGR